MKRLAAALALAALPFTASATLCDLTVINTTCVINGAIFTNNPNRLNIGSGIIAPFLTTQNNGTESGFSTDIASNALPLDDKRNNTSMFTRTLAENNIGTVDVGGQLYVEFFLDVNEPGDSPSSLISLDRLTIVNTGVTTPFNVGAPTTLAQLDAMPFQLLYTMGNNSVLLDANNFKGSGIGYDMSVLIPIADFASILDPNDRLVFATSFGQAGATIAGANTADGFEEWAARIGAVPPPPVPEPATLALLGLAAIAAGTFSRKR